MQKGDSKVECLEEPCMRKRIPKGKRFSIQERVMTDLNGLDNEAFGDFFWVEKIE